jgi:hypothetical protein
MPKKKLTQDELAMIAQDKAALAVEEKSINDMLSVARAQQALKMLQDHGLLKDATPAALTQRALEYAVAQGVYEIERYNVWREAFPLDTDMPPGADVKKYTIWSGAGIAQWYRGGGKHPNVAIGQVEKTILFHPLSVAFTVDYLEMLGSAYAGVNVEAEKAGRCYTSLDNQIEELVYIGDAAADRPGLIDHPNIATGNLPSGSWDDAGTTAADIIADLKFMIDTIVAQSEGDKAFKGLKIYFQMAPTMYRIVTSRIANSYSDETIEGVMAKSDGRFGGFIESPMHGTTAGGAGDYVSAGTFMDAASNVVSLSMDAVRMPVNDMGMVKEQPFVSKFGRYHVKYPLRFFQGEGALTPP